MNPKNFSLTRRSVLQAGLATCVASAIPERLSALTWKIADGRPAPADRRFTSPAVEAAITQVSGQISDPVLRAMFERCFPNTLDTTVFPGSFEGHPDTFVITGDIDAMWLRDSSAQVHPYLQFAKQDRALAKLLEGVVRRQTRMILIDSYANAFTRNPTDPPLSWAVHDDTQMKPGIAERKWEVDSLCYVIRLAHGYWKATGDTSPFDAEWEAAARKIVQTFREQQRLHGPGPYSFTRTTNNPYDTVAGGGFGNPARPVGMIFSMFRPSDDSCVYPLFVPANLFAMASLKRLQELAGTIGDHELAVQCEEVLAGVDEAVREYATVQRPSFGEIWAYEVDGYGNRLMMDDANAPSLLSLPYLGCCDVSDPMYQRTRKFVLSESNPYFFKGSAAEGVGSPHTGNGQIWPMGIILRALTSSDDREIVQCLRWLRDTTAKTNFMHESFDDNDPAKFTRPWFAWANTLFGELMVKVASERPRVLRQVG
ncbi:MAG TPA: glycoside hydrolase family 125 protein [Acidobacteriaceae bacterium]|nr:glycoside hydrolase family 125 protein [Acidobacteriaceae bacterium]